MAINILCLETSAAKCSVAVTIDEDRWVYKEANESFSHVAQITTLIKDCLSEAKVDIKDLNAVAVSNGPGSYTGLRVGTSTAKGICFANDIPLIAISTLKIIASQLISIELENALYIGIIDARRDEVYFAGYTRDLEEKLPPAAYILDKCSFEEFRSDYDQIVIGGDATEKASRIISDKNIKYRAIIPDAGHLSALAYTAFKEENFVELSSYKPFYLKPPNITVSKKQFFRKN